MISDDEVAPPTDWSYAMPYATSITLGHSHETLDLSDVKSSRVELEVVGASRLEMAVTPPSGSVELSSEVRRLHIRMSGQRQGQLSLTGATHITHVHVSGTAKSSSRLILDAPSVRHLAIDNVTVELNGTSQKKHRHTSSVKVKEARLTLRNRHVNDLLLAGRCEVELIRTPVEKLMCPTETHVALSTSDCVIGLVKTAEDAKDTGSASPTLVLKSDGGDKRVDVERMQNINVAIAARVTLSVRRIECVVIQGAGAILVQELARSVQIKNALAISAERGAQLIGMSGPVTLSKVAHSRITSDGQDTSPLVVAKLGDEFDVSGLSITGVQFPVSLEGLRLISILKSEAGHVVPEVPAQLRNASESKAEDSIDSSREMELASNYAELLSDLADSRGAPSSVRSELAWFRYRMRTLTAPQRWERRLLSSYELLGYGERFSAPAKLYMAVAATAAAFSLIGRPIDLSPHGALVVGHSYLDWLMTPLHLLKLGEGTEREFELPRYLDQIFRALVAAPFITAVLTVRKFVKR